MERGKEGKRERGKEGNRDIYSPREKWTDRETERKKDRKRKYICDLKLSRTVEKLWKITEELNILYKDNWCQYFKFY